MIITPITKNIVTTNYHELAVAHDQAASLQKDPPLYQILSQANNEHLEDPASFPVLFSTRNGGFHIRQVKPSDIDLQFALAQSLTQKVVTRALANIPESERQKTQDALETFGRKQLQAIHDTTPIMDRYLDLTEKAISTGNELQLKALFSCVRSYIEGQESLYELNPSLKDHSKIFQERIEKAVRLHNKAQLFFPNYSIPRLREEISFLSEELQPVLKTHVNCFLDKQTTIHAIKAFEDRDDRWDIFKLSSKSGYFRMINEELGKYDSIDTIPRGILNAFYQIRYACLDTLLKLDIFKNNHERCFTELLKCSSLQKLYIGFNTPQRFINAYFNKLILSLTPRLTSLSVKGSDITDELFEDLPEGQIKHVRIDSTNIKGTCFKSPLFKAVTSLEICDCDSIADEKLKELSCTQLHTLSLDTLLDFDGSSLSAPVFRFLTTLKIYYCSDVTDENLSKIASQQLENLTLDKLDILGTCLSAQCFKNIKQLDLDDCMFITDENLKALSSTKLNKVSLSRLLIDGSSLSAHCFKDIQTLQISSCKNIKDEHLGKLSSKSIKRLLLSFLDIDGSCFQNIETRSLTSLELSFCEEIQDVYLGLLRSNNIQSLIIKNLTIDGSFLKSLGLSNLMYLKAKVCPFLTSQNLRSISAKQLKEVTLKSLNIDESFLMTRAYSHLSSITISECSNFNLERLSIDTSHNNVRPSEIL